MADASFLILLAMAPLILLAFAHICFIRFCLAAVTSNPVCGRMMKKQGGAEAGKIYPACFIGFSLNLIFGIESKLFYVRMLLILFY